MKMTTHFLRLLTSIAIVANITVSACQSCLINVVVSRSNIFGFKYNQNSRGGIVGFGVQPTVAVFHSSALPIGIMSSPSGWRMELINSPVINYMLLRKLISASLGNEVRSIDREAHRLTHRKKWSGGFFIDETTNDPDENVVDVTAELGNSDEEGVMTSSMIMAIGFYKKWISPILPPACRFLPTCSQYGVQAIKEYGPTKGVILTAWRLARCSPSGGRGYDPPIWPPVAYNYGSY